MKKKRINSERVIKARDVLKSSAKRVIKPRSSKQQTSGNFDDSAEMVPRITNETVEHHRKEVIKGGRKYAYPIINTPKRIVGLSLVVGLISLIVFSSYTLLRLYRYNDYSDFVYNVSRVVPLPVARVGGSFVDYDDYLFELRRYVHYFATQQNVDFDSEQGQKELLEQRQRSLQRVLDNAYIDKIARQNGVSVSDDEVEAELELLRSQNKLGDGDSALEVVLDNYWNWSIDDYKRSIRDELLRQKVVQSLDKGAFTTAQEVLDKLNNGEDFAALVPVYSEDLASAGNGGEYGFELDISSQNEDPRVLEAVFNTEVGQITGIINTGYKLEIIKVLGESDGKRTAAHITILFEDITGYINDLKEEQPARIYINVEQASAAQTD